MLFDRNSRKSKHTLPPKLIKNSFKKLIELANVVFPTELSQYRFEISTSDMMNVLTYVYIEFRVRSEIVNE